MIRIYQAIIVTLALLFTLQSAHAAPSPVDDFGSLGNGSFNITGTLPDSDPNALWFSFSLDNDSFVSLDTAGSTDFGGELDTILALYDQAGSRLEFNDDCGGTPFGPPFTSCVSRTLTAAGGLYYAGVALFGAEFGETAFGFTSVDGDGDVILNIQVSAVPVPAAIWLFGTALIGFIGISRRTTVKA